MNTKAYLATAALLVGCGGGGGGGSGSTPPSENIIPLEQIPVSARGIIELGPISGGTVTLRRSNGQSIGSFTTADDGSINYNPRDIVSKIGNDIYIIATASGGQDIDADDDGYVDATPTPVRGSFRMVIPRSTLEAGQGIIVNPRAGLVSDILLGRINPSITQSALDHISRQTGAEDQNKDGIIDYNDVYGMQMKDTTGVSRVVSAVSGYIASVHAGDESKKRTALKNVAKTENHLLLTIIPNPDSNNHTPALKIQSISGGAILYTLDGSSPLPGGSGTKTANGEVIIPMQDAKLYFREQFVLNGETILGKVSGFDLMTDWTELSQTAVKYNKNLSKNPITENFTYKNTPYQISATQANISAGYEYPKQIDCSVGGDAGCQFGPYLAWSSTHEAQIKNIIHTSVKSYIDVGSVTPIFEDKYRDNISYNGANYSMIDTWTRGPNGTRTFPVRIDITIRWNNGKADYTSNRIVNSQAELDRFHTELEKSIKEYIDSRLGTKPTHPQNDITSFSGKIDPYYGGWYEILNQWNPSGTSDYPVKIIGTYAFPIKGRQTNIEATATTDAERISKSNQILSQIQSLIQTEYNSLPKPNYPKNYLIDSGFTSYRGYGYNILTTMNINGNSDYPATVYVRYTTPTGTYTTATLTANSASELSSVQTERANDAKSRIDLALDNDKYAPGATETVTNTVSYGGGSYRTIMTYSLNAGQDYPGYIDTYITYKNGTSDKLTMTVENANQKTTYASNLETQARTQIDNYNPTYSANTILSDGPYTYGSLKGDYTIKVTYNRTGENKNYPALVWIEFRQRSGGPLLDTRNIVGIGPKYANNSVEKESIKASLITQVQQRLALNTIDSSTPFARNTRRSVMDILIPSAYAAGTTSVTIQKSPNKALFTSNGKDVFTQHLLNGNLADLYLRGYENKASVGASSPEKIPLKLVLSEIQNSAEQIRMIKAQCSGIGTTSDKQYGCILSPSEQTQITTLENKIFASIGNYLNFGGGLTVGAGTAVYEEIMGIGSDVVNLVDGTMLQSLESGLTRLKSQIEPYIVNGSIDFTRVKSSLISGTTAIEQEIASLITELPGAINSLDAYNKGYYTGKIGGGIILEFVNPTKKLKLVTRGFSAGKWASTARYIIDAVKAGHSGPKIAEIAEKMRHIKWSRVEKPDLTKIQDQKLFNIVRDQYKASSTIGNGSSADALRYEKVTGILLSPAGHQTKNTEVRDSLMARLNAGEFKGDDGIIARNIVNDLTNSLNGN